MSRQTDYKPQYAQLFVDICKEGEGICDFCIKVDIVRATFYTWVDTHPEFREAFHKGKEYTESILTRAGFDGMLNSKNFDSKVWSILMKNKCSYVNERKVAIDFTGCKTADEKMAILNERVAEGRLTPKEAKDYADYIALSATIHEKTEVEQRLTAIEAQVTK